MPLHSALDPDLGKRLQQACTDLERRLRAGEDCTAEDLFRSYLDVAAHRDAALELLYTEFVLRQELGQRPSTTAWLARFPQWREDLEQLFQVHDLVGAGANTTVVYSGSTPSAGSAETRGGPQGSPRHLGNYELLREIARGGMGVVYEARQQGLNRLVAVKMIRAGGDARPEELARFRVEAEAVARLQHPNIVQIHEVGEHDGQPYLALEYVGGGSLQNRLAGAPQPPAEAARMVATLARAVHYAHQRGVVHRDLKPANILLEGTDRATRDTATGVSPAASRPLPSQPLPAPKISDFGLVKRLEVESGLTTTGAIVGTPSYMAPEQAQGRLHQIGPRTDVYGLGTILYEMLTGRPPFRGATVLETLEQVRGHEPVPPRHLQPRVPRDLETICLKCLRKESVRRYPSALELAADLERFLAGRPIAARPVAATERLWRWCRRQPALAGLAVTLLVVVGISFGLVTALWRSAEGHRREAEARRVEAETNLAQAQSNFLLARQAVDDYSLKVSGDKRLRGNRPLRQELLRTAVPFYERFLEQRSDDPAVRAELGKASLRLADLTKEIGNIRQAARRAEQAVELFAGLAAEDPSDARYQKGLAASHSTCGRVYMVVGDTEKAEAALRAALTIQQRQAELGPLEPEEESSLAAAHSDLGLLYYRQKRGREAEEAFQAALVIRRRLVSLHPDAPVFRSALANTLSSLGIQYMSEGKRGPAEKVYLEAVALGRSLAQEQATDEGYHQQLTRVLSNLGILYYELGEMDKARQVYEEAAAVECQLVASQPEVLAHQLSLARTLDNLGNALRALGKQPEAEQRGQEAHALFKRLADEHPDVMEYAMDLAGSYGNRGMILRHQKRPQEALECYEAAMKYLGAVLKKEPNHPVALDFLSRTYEARGRTLAGLGRLAEAVRDCDQALALDNGKDRTHIRRMRAPILARAGEHARAVAEVDDLVRDKTASAEVLYDLACVCGLAAAAVRDDQRLATDERARLAERYGARAMELLRQVRDAGFFKTKARADQLNDDTDLAAVRSRADFQTLVSEVKGQARPRK
jgi:serine/threonine-protein kinase